MTTNRFLLLLFFFVCLLFSSNVRIFMSLRSNNSVFTMNFKCNAFECQISHSYSFVFTFLLFDLYFVSSWFSSPYRKYGMRYGSPWPNNSESQRPMRDQLVCATNIKRDSRTPILFYAIYTTNSARRSIQLWSNDSCECLYVLAGACRLLWLNPSSRNCRIVN